MSATNRSDRSDGPVRLVLHLVQKTKTPTGQTGWADRSDRSYAEPAQTELVLPFISSSTNATWCGASVGAYKYIS